MRNVFFVLVLVAGCTGSNYKKVQEKKDGLNLEYWLNNRGQNDGVSFVSYKSGALKNMMLYKDGLIEGKTLGYYENGSLHVLANYKNGKKEGFKTTLFENGKLKEIAFFKNDEPEYFVKYDEIGSIIDLYGQLPVTMIGKTNLKVLEPEEILYRNKFQKVLIYKHGCSYDLMKISIDEGEITATKSIGIYEVKTNTKKNIASIKVSARYPNGSLETDIYEITVK